MGTDLGLFALLAVGVFGVFALLAVGVFGVFALLAVGVFGVFGFVYVCGEGPVPSVGRRWVSDGWQTR